jgi:predicted nucleotidyltransferase
MKNFGLNKQELTKILSVFNRHPEIIRVMIFGSRAKGTSRPNSDIDFAVDGISGDLQVESLAMELDELSLPYKFEVKSIATISNRALRGHIERIGVTIYP